MSIRFTFLGTGTSQGVPPIGCEHPVCLSDDFKDKRLRVSALINFNQKNIVIDCGPDFRQQMLREGVRQLSAILFTHEHNDHTAGLDDIRPLVFKQQADLPIYGNKKTIAALQKRFDYVFDVNYDYPGIPRVKTNLVGNDLIGIDDFVIEPIHVVHGKLPILGYKFNKKLAYITDASKIPDTEKHKLKNLDVLVLNALRVQPKHYSHFILDEALDLIKELAPKKAYLTHISYEMGFHEQVQNTLPAGVFLAYDGLTVEC